jgi:hypothetical protein
MVTKSPLFACRILASYVVVLLVVSQNVVCMGTSWCNDTSLHLTYYLLPLCRKMYNPHWFQIPGLTGPHWQKDYILKTRLAGILRHHIGPSIMHQLGADFQTPST